MSEAPRVKVETKDAARCPYCHDPVRVTDDKEACRACMAWHHLECWESHTGCSACGAEVVRRRKKRRPQGRRARPSCAHGSCSAQASIKVGRRRFCVEHGVARGRKGVVFDTRVAAVVAGFSALFLLVVGGLAVGDGELGGALLVAFLTLFPFSLAGWMYRQGAKRNAKIEAILRRRREAEASRA